MKGLGDLLLVDERRTLEFFVLGLKDVSEARLDTQELLYNASVLAHFALVSTHAEGGIPAPADLSMVFDQFVFSTTVSYDGMLLETAGAQCLLLAGFFEDQMRGRHNIRWYSELGSSFLSRAAFCQESRQKAHLLTKLAQHFELWRRRHARLSRELRDQAYLLTPPPQPHM